MAVVTTLAGTQPPTSLLSTIITSHLARPSANGVSCLQRMPEPRYTRPRTTAELDAGKFTPPPSCSEVTEKIVCTKEGRQSSSFSRTALMSTNSRAEMAPPAAGFVKYRTKKSPSPKSSRLAPSPKVSVSHARRLSQSKRRDLSSEYEQGAGNTVRVFHIFRLRSPTRLRDQISMLSALFFNSHWAPSPPSPSWRLGISIEKERSISFINVCGSIADIVLTLLICMRGVSLM
mmetsp:Transcript_22907/g.40967  ORF Transcript_22907/g.40967 Transcript_22907/m.40967 type:complete len:232 (+) Transcript_22907:258-953(+)